MEFLDLKNTTDVIFLLFHFAALSRRCQAFSSRLNVTMRERTTGGFRPCLRPSFPMLECSRGVHGGIGWPRRRRRREHEVNDTVGIDHFCRWRARPPQTTHAGRSFRLFATPACGNCAPCPRWQGRRSKILSFVRAITVKRNRWERTHRCFSTRRWKPLSFSLLSSKKKKKERKKDSVPLSRIVERTGRYRRHDSRALVDFCLVWCPQESVDSFSFFYFRFGEERRRGFSGRVNTTSVGFDKAVEAYLNVAVCDGCAP